MANISYEPYLNRYTEEQKWVIAGFFAKLTATSNKTGKMLESKKTKIIESWEAYPAKAVISALEVYLKMDIQKASNGKGKNEKYVLGIIKNKSAEVGNGSSSKHSREGTEADEGERLQQLAGGAVLADSDLECEF